MIFANYSNGEVVEALAEALTKDEFIDDYSNECSQAIRDGYLQDISKAMLEILKDQYGDFEPIEDEHDLCAGLKTEMGESI